MFKERNLRVFHIIVTAQFVISAALVVFWSLYEANLNWWAIFSLSTQAIVILVLGTLIYGFAVFCGSVGDRIEGEHPLSGSIYYRLFYLAMPVLAGVATGADYFVNEGALEGLRGWALGTVLSAYAIWLFIDPIVGISELALPGNRAIRRTRIAAEREKRERERHERAQLLTKLRAERVARAAALKPMVDEKAARLAAMVLDSADDPRRGYDEGAGIGLAAWQTAGMETMRDLYAATLRECRKRGRADLAGRLDYWWDGIGQWRQGETVKSISEG
jgi:hypothetical protein